MKWQRMDPQGGLYIPMACRDQFYYLRTKRQWRYIIYKISEFDFESVEVDKCGLRDSSFEEFQHSLPENEARWAVYDFEYTITEYDLESRKSKMLFIVYSPDSNTNSKEKNTILFNKNTLKKKIFSRQEMNKNLMEYTAYSKTEIDFETIKERL